MFRKKDQVKLLSYIEAVKEMCKAAPSSIVYDEDNKRSTVFLEGMATPMIITDEGVSHHLARTYIDHVITINPCINSMDEIDDIQIILTKTKTRKGVRLSW